ncbi:hypothetical protein [Streptomonospora wellingtoniae]|uniref:Uncharacterized protein n=1 Tax=Streptomonospora wellingtoniae TaxID=3075544 RepID=A0ABU2KUJ4_9ACTN|nr:hypothetical protein [Streptomonospora sp. DSM 45055]MDT0302925.1 hypothetical protein [Streptomonospora sp. DSM 45055]
MSDPKTCTRCRNPIPKAPDEGWVNKALLRKQAIRYGLRFNMWRFRWMPEDPGDQARLSYTELDLCSPCAGAVFLFAQGKEADR